MNGNTEESELKFDFRLQEIGGAHSSAKSKQKKKANVPANYVTPGTVVTSEFGYMRGHGTFTSQEGNLVASLVGCVERVNRLVTVKGIGGVYFGDVGDVVIGRITRCMQKRWKVDINSRLDGILLLSSINLPTGELRRRSAEDELAMRDILKEGDVISAEIQSVYNDGSLALHTRSTKYGKLGPGVLVTVSSSCIKRRKNHIHNLPCGACVILGNNGYIWISSLPNGRMPGTNLGEEPEGGKVMLEDIRITAHERKVVARLKNAILILSKSNLPIFDTSIMYAYEASSKWEPKDLLNPDIAEEIGDLVRQQMSMDDAIML